MAAVPSLGRASGIEGPGLARESAAASELYERYARQIYRFCLARLRSREEAEDATQTTFLNAFRGLSRGVTPEVEQAWLYKIAENVCLTRVRSNVRRLRVESPTDLEPLHESVAAPAMEAVDLEVLQDALARLPGQQRRAILLREWQGLSYAEIATELGLSQSAVETLIFRARRSLAKQLREEEKNGVLRKLANAGTVVGWLKSILLGGSTAAKIAAVVAAGAAVAAGTATEVATHHHTVVAQASAKSVPAAGAPALTRMPVLYRPAVTRGSVGRKAQPMRLAPVRRAAAPTVVGSVRTPGYSSGRRTADEAVHQESRGSGTAPAEHSAPAAPVSAPAAAGQPAPAKAEEQKPAKADDQGQNQETKPAAKPEHPAHPVVPAPDEHAATPPAPKDKAPDAPKPIEPADDNQQ